ncbi:N-acetyltransferase [Photobacterium sp. ZSDE20]|uniref:N-acetyltransferase n=1 Tax=Photobacterium pectinilyticum TaxID=2906793 RepID=A0ABT1N0A4_9GAMM|nr:N-acetyltransferase [Photobacterium sp. ZSDE20]MCQ1058171.1 N-acetyltransferase [Photobacterium sp. ZSDE20]MDD1822895.1 N-acetyltransferase [Photobacterium sp. ZSDE20]
MLIRSEAPADIMPIDFLLKSVFETEAEAALVMRLRENGKRTLSLVACNDDGELVGYMCFSPVMLDGEDHHWQGLAPMAIKPEYQRQGIGQAMIEEAKQTLAELGYPVIVVLGHPDYYPKAGFAPAASKGIQCPWPVPEEVFMVLEAVPGAMDGKTGMISYSEEFNAL